ncbi:DNA recombination protein RmuC [Sphingosinicella xenopeptidilytica]|uniref:DNA recombination protein RmuC homolog n=1 Tax=Sphingosinicella xenopeptidilytica TaxID=364098 RepID=A0ABW3C6C7_SPHXN
MTPLALIVSLAMLAVGCGLGWLLWARDKAALRTERDSLRAERDGLADAVAALRTDKALAEQRAAAVDGLTAEIAELRKDSVALAELKSRADERERAFAEREADLQQRFDTLASASLSKSHETFVKLAEETLKRHREAAGEGLQKNRAEMDKLIQPMRDTLAKYEQKLGQIEEARATAYGAIHNAIAEVKQGQERVSGEAAKLVNALRSAPKARGRWGEHQLRRVLEMAGLSPHVDFAEEVSVETEDGRQRPDAVVHLPGERVLVIDAKCSLNSYQDALDAPDEDARRAHLLAHARNLRVHVDALGKKSYSEQFGDTLDFVIMFVPGENFLAAALEADQELFETAFQRRVLLASPTNLIAIARTVAMVWQQERASADARAIAELGKQLYDRLATMGEHVAKVGRNLEAANTAYNKMVGSLESQVMTSAHRLREHAIAAPSKTVEELPRVTGEPRPLTKLAAE